MTWGNKHRNGNEEKIRKFFLEVELAWIGNWLDMRALSLIYFFSIMLKDIVNNCGLYYRKSLVFYMFCQMLFFLF